MLNVNSLYYLPRASCFCNWLIGVHHGHDNAFGGFIYMGRETTGLRKKIFFKVCILDGRKEKERGKM